jgi:hypothetical protein
MNSIGRSRWVVVAGIAAAMVLTLSRQANVARGDSPAALPDEPELTAKWWEWVYSLPVSKNPLFDETGALAGTAQPYKGSKVFFLVGVISLSGTVERSITVPAGTAFFFPLINTETDNIGLSPQDSFTVPELRAGAASIADDAADLHVTLNGTSLLDSVERIVSPPFAYHLPDEDNIYQFLGLDFTGTVAPAVSDGYWLFIPPLQKGTYDLNFGGSFPDFGFTLDVTYHITVE